MGKTKEPYAELHQISKNISTLSSIEMLLGWDQETYMPQNAISIRADQTSAMAGLIHKQKTSASFAKALERLIDLKTGELKTDRLSAAQNAALREWRRDFLKVKKLPNSFVKLFSTTTSQAQHVWANARKNNRFADFAPYLEKIVSLSKKKAELLGYQEHPYDALLDLYEPEMKTSYLIPLFANLKNFLTDLLKKIGARPTPRTNFLHGDFPASHQLQLANDLLKAMGFHHDISRLDQSSHPFCTGLHPKDTRMTTRVHADALLPNIFAVIHEGGHGLYNMDLPEEHFGSPLGEQASLGIDESQSRFWETRIGHSLPFWHYFYPRLQTLFPETFKKVSLEEFYKAINLVKASFIRIESDEVTYSLHIIVRFEIEKALIEGSLKVKQVPEVWNEKMRQYFGITPSNDAEGCLQDIHWSIGAIGYFPTYTLGNLYAAQFFTVFEKAHPTWKEKVAKGDLSFIKQWLHENIHRYGRQFTPHELVKRITGKPLSEQAYIDYLTQKFGSLYTLP